MTREAAEKRVSNCIGHAMRAAAIRLARERAGEEPDPSLAIGCVDWYRYDAKEPEEGQTAFPYVAAGPDGDRRSGVSAGH